MNNRIENVLIYCPNVGGHRLIHVLHYIDFLKSKNKKIFVVYSGLRSLTNSEIDNDQTLLKNNEYLKIILNDSQVSSKQVNSFNSNIKDLKELVSFQKSHNIQSTIHVDGDAYIGLFTCQLLPFVPKLIGKNGALFIMSEFLYEAEKYPNHYKFKYWFFNNITFKKFNVLDFGFFTDENVIKSIGNDKFIHIPDFIPYKVKSELPAEKKPFYTRIRTELEQFLEMHQGKEIILSFGDLEKRKGFDFLVELTAKNPDLILVRLGRTKPGHSPNWIEVTSKERLILENRIFIIDMYIEDDSLINFMFSKVKFLLLPYRYFYRTSGVLLQALNNNLPVLTPSTGLFESRVKDNGIGEVFTHHDFKSFEEKFNTLTNQISTYQSNIETYKEDFSLKALHIALGEIIGDEIPNSLRGSNFNKGHFVSVKFSFGQFYRLFRYFYRKTIKKIKRSIKSCLITTRA